MAFAQRRGLGTFNRYNNRLYAIWEEVTQSRRLKQRKYRKKRQRRLVCDFKAHFSDDETI